MELAVESLDPRRHAQDLAETWQARALVHTQRQHIGAVLLSVLAHNYDDAMPVLLRVAFPGFQSIKPPFLCSAAKVAKSGHIVAGVINTDGSITKQRAIYRSEGCLRDDFRRLADRLKLSDRERNEMFGCVRRWVVADTRLDPTFDPQDPDAKRIVN